MRQKSIGDLIFDFNKTLKVEIEKEFKSFNIGVGQLHILLKLYLVKDQYCRQSDLVESLGIDKSNASRSLAKLEEKGLVEFIYINKRDKGIKLTEISEGIKFKIITSLQNISKKMTHDISDEDIDNAYRVIEKMNKNLEI
jgi:DNA-binding MarR family transcriptional regulator